MPSRLMRKVQYGSQKPYRHVEAALHQFVQTLLPTEGRFARKLELAVLANIPRDIPFRSHLGGIQWFTGHGGLGPSLASDDQFGTGLLRRLQECRSHHHIAMPSITTPNPARSFPCPPAPYPSLPSGVSHCQKISLCEIRLIGTGPPSRPLKPSSYTLRATRQQVRMTWGTFQFGGRVLFGGTADFPALLLEEVGCVRPGKAG